MHDMSVCSECMYSMDSREGKETTIWADIEGSMTVWDKDWLKVCLYTGGQVLGSLTKFTSNQFQIQMTL